MDSYHGSRLDQEGGYREGEAAGQRALGQVFELAAVVVLASVWFFWGTGVGDFVATEALRAVVVKEMLERDQWLLPTVHERVYLRKPPLYAWTTAALAKVVGRFDEQVARWPAAAMGVFYVVVLWLGGRWLVDRRAGPAAAVLGAGNWIVLDYGTRAELDSGVLALTTLAVLLLGWAWMNQGRRRVWGLVGCYLAALAGSFWKAPHVLLTVWLTLAGLAWLDRRAGRREWRAFALGWWQLALSAVCLSVLALWFMVLSRAVGTARAGRFVVLEFLARVVPHSLSHLVEIVLALPYLAIVTFPASVWAAGWVAKRARAELDEGEWTKFNFLLAWLLPNLAFLLFVPAKSPRYWFPVFGPVVLLALLTWRRYRRGLLASIGERTCEWICRCLLAGGSLTGLALVLGGAALMLGHFAPAGIQPVVGGTTMLACGSIMILAAGWGLSKRRLQQWRPLGAVLAVLLVAAKPVQVTSYLPARSVAMSLRPSAMRIDQLVPRGTAAFVLSDKPGNDRSGELADFGYYCQTRLYWPLDVDEALRRSAGQWCYLLVQPEGREHIVNRFGRDVEEVAQLDGGSKQVFLLRLSRVLAVTQG